MKVVSDRFKRHVNHQKRAVVAAHVAVLMGVLLGMTALTVDMGTIYNAKADLQRTADAAALAAATRLAEYDNVVSPLELARAAAVEFAQRNTVLGETVTIDPSEDITFGRAVFNTSTQQYDFVPDNTVPDAVYVRVRKTEGSTNGSVTLYFARVFGRSSAGMVAEAVAVMVPRDIAIVADLSGSHNDDSEFRHYQVTNINLIDVWDSLPGGIDDAQSTWNPESINEDWIQPDGSIPQAAGPAWGYMRELGLGTTEITSDYDPAADPGLIKLPQGQDWSDANLRSHLFSRGYSGSEVDAIMSRDYDSAGAYQYRTAVALGLAVWNSGHPGGLWESRGLDASETGNGNNNIGGSEVDWVETIFNRPTAVSSSLWRDYINNYMTRTSTRLYHANPAFKYRYGVKTFVNYLMERKSTHNQTPELAEVPAQPMQAVKDAVRFMVSLVDDLDSDDKMSLEIYGTTARHEVDLTHNHWQIGDRLNEMQSSHYDGWTNVGGGLERAIEELDSDRARGTSRKMIILLTDGRANVNAGGSVNDYTGGANYALEQAQQAADRGIRVFAVSVGVGADQGLMDQVADIGDGEHFHAGGSIGEYSEQLAAIFQRLGSKRSVELIR